MLKWKISLRSHFITLSKAIKHHWSFEFHWTQLTINFFYAKYEVIKKHLNEIDKKCEEKEKEEEKKGKRMEKRGNGKRQLKKCVWAMNKKNSIAECNGEMVTISRWIWNLFAHKTSSLLWNRSWFAWFDKWSGCVCARNPALKLNYILYCKNEKFPLINQWRNLMPELVRNK